MSATPGPPQDVPQSWPGHPAPAYPPAHPPVGQQPGYPAQGYPPPGYVPPGYVPRPAYPNPPKRRPSGWLFLPGAVALVLALAIGVYGGLAIIGVFHTDGYVDAGSRAAVIELDGSGEHMLFTIAGTSTPTCTVTEGSAPLALTEVTETETVDLDSGSWVPFASFTAQGTEVQVSCLRDAGIPIRIGAPAGGSEYLRIGIAVIAAGALGLAGLAATIVLAVLFVSRPSRKVIG